MRLATLITLASMLLVPLTTACTAADAQPAHMAGPVTAGPLQPVDVPAGGTIPLSLEDTTDPAAVFQSDGLIVAGDAVMISARVTLNRGAGTVAVQLGPRGGPWRTIAAATDPPIISPVIVEPRAGEMARLVFSSALGAELRSGVEPRQTYLTAVPLPTIADPNPGR